MPKYGGTITIQSSADITNFDPYNASALPTVMGGWLELFYDTDWTLNPTIFDYKLTILNPNYYTPHMATGWEFSAARPPLWSICDMMSTGRTLRR